MIHATGEGENMLKKHNCGEPSGTQPAQVR